MIKRHLLSELSTRIQKKDPLGIILPGIIGSGKTTLVLNLIEELKSKGFNPLMYSGDDTNFRRLIREDSKIIFHEIASQGLERPLVFVDEIQKEPEIFDAMKYAYDHIGAAFILTGSNPAFLKTEARDRLQRRGLFISLPPLSLSEILLHEGLIQNYDRTEFENLLFEAASLKSVEISREKWDPKIDGVIERYLKIGGIPRAWLAKTPRDSLIEIQTVSERGITETYKSTVAREDEIRRYLAMQNSQEFAYQGLHQTLRSSRRDIVDQVIDHLLNHGYLVKKRPYLFEYEHTKKTYHSVYSWIDPGIVSYYSASLNPEPHEQGYRIEGYVHAHLEQYRETYPLSTALYYFKPFNYKAVNDSLFFQPGEIDFLIVTGKRMIPIEVKKTAKIQEIDTQQIEKLISQKKLPYGIILYGGAPFVDKSRRLVFFPFWKI